MLWPGLRINVRGRCRVTKFGAYSLNVVFVLNQEIFFNYPDGVRALAVGCAAGARRVTGIGLTARIITTVGTFKPNACGLGHDLATEAGAT
jgi:hypothetical protein